MIHRHLQHQGFTHAAIDDVIARGGRQDSEALRDATRADPTLREKIRQVCAVKLSDPYAQRYYFWNHYVQERRTALTGNAFFRQLHTSSESCPLPFLWVHSRL